MWWHLPVSQQLRKPRQEDHREFRSQWVQGYFSPTSLLLSLLFLLLLFLSTETRNFCFLKALTWTPSPCPTTLPYFFLLSQHFPCPLNPCPAGAPMLWPLLKPILQFPPKKTYNLRWDPTEHSWPLLKLSSLGFCNNMFVSSSQRHLSSYLSSLTSCRTFSMANFQSSVLSPGDGFCAADPHPQKLFTLAKLPLHLHISPILLSLKTAHASRELP